MAKAKPFSKPKTCNACENFTTTNRSAFDRHINNCSESQQRRLDANRAAADEEFDFDVQNLLDALPNGLQVYDMRDFCETLIRRFG